MRGARLSAEFDLGEDQHLRQDDRPVRSHRDIVRARRNAAAWRGYAASATIVGPVDHSLDPRVHFRRVASPSERVALTLLVVLNATTAVLFISWLLLPAHIPGHGVVGFGNWQLGVARISFCVVIAVEVIRLVQNFAVWTFAFNAKDPVPKALNSGWRVALLTTIVPSREPLHVVERTLEAMLQVRYRGSVDVWILDEGDDPAVRAMAARLGVHHFSRKGLAEFNTAEGAFRAKTKSGNHNSWRAHHERDYDVVAQMDPDHVPLPCFLERTLGYFRDPDVAFVVAPQVYGNMYDNWVAHGASVQQYLFSGVVERGGNGLHAPLLIGTNHLYRPAAWRQIGGYQDSIIEDHLTSMRVQGTVNPATDNNWKGVYTPDVLAIGEAPASWTDYFNQQKRWSYGIWEILLKRKLRRGIQLTFSQRLMYGLVQFYYPSVGSTVLLGTVATSVYLLLGITALHVNGAAWVALWSLNMLTWFILWLWLRRFYLAEHERREVGMPGMLLALFAGPVYVAAGARALLGRRLKYVVTAKGKLRTGDSARTFALHTVWGSLAAVLMAVSFLVHHDLLALRIWASLAVVVGAGPPAIESAARFARLRADRAHVEIRDTHAWQRDMVEDFTSPDLIPLFEMAALQSGSLQAADGADELAAWPPANGQSRAAAGRNGSATAGGGRPSGASGNRAAPRRPDRDAVDWPNWPPVPVVVDARRTPARNGASGTAPRVSSERKRRGSHRAVAGEHRDTQIPDRNAAWYE